MLEYWNTGMMGFLYSNIPTFHYSMVISFVVYPSPIEPYILQPKNLLDSQTPMASAIRLVNSFTSISIPLEDNAQAK